MKTGEDAKIVTWAVNDKTGFQRKTISNIARDYEAKHPGWKVVGGINADQYYTKYGTGITSDGSDYFYPQPYYPMIADYEKWFAVTATPANNGHIVGFTNDGSIDQLLYYNAGWNYNENNPDKAKLAGLVVRIDNEKFIIENINEAPKANQSSLYTPYYQGTNIPTMNVTGSHLFVVEDAELAYMSNSVTYTYKPNNNKNAFFGKGIITSQNTSVTLNQGDFAIDTTNPDLLAALKVGKKLVVQFEFQGPLNEVESGIGFHFIMRKDNVDQPMVGSYNTSLYPRTMFGRKADGTITFVTVDGRQESKGMYGIDVQEGNAILKHYGVVEAYQLDGGGSVTMIVRDGDKFVTVNSPSDGSDRQVLSALFMVVKVPKVTESITIYHDKLSFNVTNLDANIEELHIKLNNEIKQVINGKVEFTNLLPNTEYDYQYFIKKNDKLIGSVMINQVQTAKRSPTVNSVSFIKGEKGVEIELDIFDPDKAITRKSIAVNDVSQLLNQNTVTFMIDDFNFENIIIYFSYDINDGQGRKDITITNFKVYCNLVTYMENIKNILKERVRVYE